jgi:hypothetical protein
MTGSKDISNPRSGRNEPHPQGKLGSAILKKRLYVPVTIPCSQREEGALGDPPLLIATKDIYPGKQLTRSNVSGVLKTSLTTPVRVGSYAQLTVRVTPPARCTIRVMYEAVSRRTSAMATDGRTNSQRIRESWSVA